MLERILLSASVEEMPNWFSVSMGLGTVFVGLICIVFICMIVGLICRNKKQEKPEEPQQVSSVQAAEIIENRQEIIAAVTAVAAEDMGKDVSAIRVLSFEKL